MKKPETFNTKSKLIWRILGGLGLFFILCSLLITVVEYQHFSAQPLIFPSGSVIAGLPVCGLSADEAADRLAEFYSLPLVLEINNTIIHVPPEELGFTIDTQVLIEKAIAQIDKGSFWAYLWNHTSANPVTEPLAARVDQTRLRAYLTTQIVPRYASWGSPIIPIPGTTNFQVGTTGDRLDIDRAVEDITAALQSPSTHTLTLHTTSDTTASPSMDMLEAFLRHNINWIGFDEIVEIYLEPMDGGQPLHFAVQNGQIVEPDVAFTAASTIKIPIMISVLRRTDQPTPEAVVNLLERMIVNSENPPADTLMSTYLDEIRGPLMVSEDLSALGMENTFLAGYFYLGAPVLQIFTTPANSRTDINLDPDIYNQTVASQVGQLLTAIYTCAEDGSGLLTATFPGEITQTECQLMVDILSANKIGVLIEAGLPPGTTAAHKHGWVQELDGLLHSMSDVAIVFSPGQDYVLNIFIYDPIQLDFDQGNRLIARLSQTVYNFFNIENQAYWWFD